MKATKQEMIDTLMERNKELEEQVRELRDIVNGHIREYGYKWNDIYSSQNGKWEINTSSILTKLIQVAGRICNYHANDLFIQWQCDIAPELENGKMESQTFVFAFYESGVHHKSWWEPHKDDYNYYREVWFLDVIVDGDKITMDLHR